MFVFVFLRWPLFQPSIHWIHCFAMFCSFRATAPATHQGDLAQFSESLLNNGTPTRQQVQSLGWWIITASEEPKRRCLGAIFSKEFHVRLEMVSTCFDTMYLCFMYLYDSIVGCNLMKYWSRWVSHQDRCLLQNWQLAPEVGGEQMSVSFWWRNGPDFMHLLRSEGGNVVEESQWFSFPVPDGGGLTYCCICGKEQICFINCKHVPWSRGVFSIGLRIASKGPQP